VSELRRPDANQAVVRHAAELDPDDIFISAVTLGEIAKGVALLPDGRRRREFASWLLGLERQFEDRILPVDLEVGRVWGELTARAQSQGVQVPAVDGLIAATAIRHGLHVMTRNTRDFTAAGALIIDSWQE
jgi:predicted nucleic acid-binding protein